MQYTTFKEAVSQYIATYAEALAHANMTPKKEFDVAKEVLYDFAANMDKQAVITTKPVAA